MGRCSRNQKTEIIKNVTFPFIFTARKVTLDFKVHNALKGLTPARLHLTAGVNGVHRDVEVLHNVFNINGLKSDGDVYTNVPWSLRKPFVQHGFLKTQNLMV